MHYAVDFILLEVANVAPPRLLGSPVKRLYLEIDVSWCRIQRIRIEDSKRTFLYFSWQIREQESELWSLTGENKPAISQK